MSLSQWLLGQRGIDPLPFFFSFLLIFLLFASGFRERE
jgi:hypothetical protein